MSKIIVPQAQVNHLAEVAGVHLLSTPRVGLFSKVKVWCLRFYAPSSKTYMSHGTLHTIEHILNVKLREYLGSKVIQFSPIGSCTGFTLVTKGSVSQSELIKALIQAIEDVIPICDKEELPNFNEVECSRPTFFNLKGATDALNVFKLTLI